MNPLAFAKLGLGALGLGMGVGGKGRPSLTPEQQRTLGIGQDLLQNFNVFSLAGIPLFLQSQLQLQNQLDRLNNPGLNDPISRILAGLPATPDPLSQFFSLLQQTS